MALNKPMKVLAVASAGGHWVQLQRMRAAFAAHDVCYVTTLKGVRVDGSEVVVVRDASRTDKVGLIILILQLFWLIAVRRPDVVVTTGAAPGVLSLRIAKLFGARTVWIDSIANVNELSLSGMLARRYSDLWLTQWNHLVPKYEGLSYLGSVI